MASLDEGIESVHGLSGQHAVCQPLPAPKDQVAGTSLDRGQGAGLGFERERVLFVPEKRGEGRSRAPWGEPGERGAARDREAMALPCRGSLAGCPTQSWLGGGTGERGCCLRVEGTGPDQALAQPPSYLPRELLWPVGLAPAAGQLPGARALQLASPAPAPGKPALPAH